MKKTNITNTPLTFDIREDLLRKVNSFRAKAHARSVSEVIRYALSSFSFDKFKPQVKNHKQISVRIPDEMRLELSKNAKTKNVSLGELLRAALEALPEVPKKVAPAPVAAPKAAKPAKAAPKAAKVAPKVTKSVAKKPVKKAVAKSK